MGALGESLLQTAQSQAVSDGRRIGKGIVMVSLFLGLALGYVGGLWVFGNNQVEEPATSLAVANTMKLPNLRSPMVQQVRTRNYMMPVQASNSPNSGEMTKREMLGGAVASAAALLPSAANAGVQFEYKTPPKDRAETGAGIGTLLLPVTAALGWVGFNILGPASSQLDAMTEDNFQKTSGRKR